MVVAIVLSGGTGTRLGNSIPKQYIEVKGKPIINYCLETFEKHSKVDSFIIVAAKSWERFISKTINESAYTKFRGFASAGTSRQHSILNGLKKAFEIGMSDTDSIIIHDAARPNVSNQLITECIEKLKEADGVMPVVPVKDTIYISENGNTIDSLLNRDLLFAGQAPEGFILGKYYDINKNLTEVELAKVRGTSEIAHMRGFKISLIKGDEQNYKITTLEDLEKFKTE